MPITIKEETPYGGRDDLIIHYAEDENGDRYLILQKETGNVYESAVDVLPCRFTYEPTEERVETSEGEGDIIEENNTQEAE